MVLQRLRIILRWTKIEHLNRHLLCTFLGSIYNVYIFRAFVIMFYIDEGQQEHF